MINSYYKIPLETKKIIDNENVKKSNIRESISDYIHLIVTTHFGECSFDESFGCSIWDVDFDNLTSTNKLRDLISESLRLNISTQEKRLKKTQIKVTIRQEEFNEGKKLKRVKKRVDIKIDGIVRQTNEAFSCIERFYIAPLSY
ncbi:GPW/gp25 family protein [Ascidiimonas sp. W6]|uniref:GPW/gp25 family protein n=1 Tax=Ascidiimonas meishanensis TaxID=3128903 RepID=UPI0030EDBB5C